MTEINTNNKDIILYDGVCILCNTFITVILKLDTKRKFLFSSLQSNYSKSILKITDSTDYKINTVFLIRNGKKYTKSTAVLMILTSFSNLFKIFYIFYLIPKFIRDMIYDLIANKRYAFFGKTGSCPIPPVKVRKRFLD